MGFDVYLRDKNGNSVQVDTHNEGGTIKIEKSFFIDNTLCGGTSDAEVSITFNYNKFYREALHPKGLMYLDGKTGKQVIPLLKKAIRILGTEQHYDYWASTPGNAGHALSTLLTWAEQHPQAKFVVHG